MPENSLDDDIQVAIGYGSDGPTMFLVGECVQGVCCPEDAEVIIAILRDIADAVEFQMENAQNMAKLH